MARAFDINSSTTRIDLKDASPRGQVTFTVANRLGKLIEVQTMVVPDDPKRAGWYRLESDHKSLAADQTEKFDVAVAVPPGTANGDYSFKLVAANVASPDDESTEGPSVAVHYVQGVPPPPRRWWLILVIVGALAVVGVGLWLILRPHHPVGKACTKAEDCGADQKCTQLPSGQQACQLKPQEKCSRDVDCSSFWCIEGTKKCSRDDGKCESDAECRPPAFACVNNLCLKKINESCSAPTDCTTGNCQQGKCAPAFEVCAQACPRGTICSHGRCLRVFIPDTFHFNVEALQPLRKTLPP